MREAKSMPDLCWWIVSVPSSFVWLTAADAAWANRPDGSSTIGHVIMAAHPNILHGESSTVSVLAWNSRKIRRVVRSSLGAECVAFSTGLEHTDMFRVLYGELCGDLCDLAEYETYLQVTESLCVNDCKSLADALLAAGSAASKTSEGKRLGIELKHDQATPIPQRDAFSVGRRRDDACRCSHQEQGTRTCRASEEAAALRSISDPRNLRDVGGKTTSS